MRELSSNQTVTNLTQAWWNQEKSDLLAWNGYFLNGSDYDLLQKLIHCLRRAPDCPLSDRIQSEWQALFGTAFPFEAATAEALWQYSARALLDSPITREQAAEILKHVPSAKTVEEGQAATAITFPVRAVSVNRLSFSHESWRSWAARAEKHLECRIEQGELLALILPASFQPQKPNLYRVERILASEEINEDLWLSQMAYFLFGFCAKRGIRPLLLAQCSLESVLDLLKMLTDLTPAPSLMLQADCQPSADTWSKICQTVLQNRQQASEGDPPVFFISKGTIPAWLPKNLSRISTK